MEGNIYAKRHVVKTSSSDERFDFMQINVHYCGFVARSLFYDPALFVKLCCLTEIINIDIQLE